MRLRLLELLGCLGLEPASPTRGAGDCGAGAACCLDALASLRLDEADVGLRAGFDLALGSSHLDSPCES